MRSLLILLTAGLIAAGNVASTPLAMAAEPTVTWSEDGMQLTVTAPIPGPVPAPKADPAEVETAEAGEPGPVEATAENVAASIPNVRFGRALKRAALLLRLSGKIDRQTRIQIVEFVDCPERTNSDGEVVDLLEQLKNATVEQMVEQRQGGERVGFNLLDLVQLIIDNREAILEFIQMLLELFAQNQLILPAEQYVFDSPGVPPPQYSLAV